MSRFPGYQQNRRKPIFLVICLFLTFLLAQCCFLPASALPALSTQPVQQTEGSQKPESAMKAENTVKEVIAVNQVPEKPVGRNIYINDLAGLLNPSDRSLLQNRLMLLDDNKIAQISLLILPATDRDLSEFAPVILTQWDIQHYKKRDGLLILVNADRLLNQKSGNRIFVATGYATEALLPDAVIGRILDDKALPLFARGQFSKGLTDSTLAMASILSGDKQLTKQYAKPRRSTPWLSVVFFLLFLFLMRQGGGRGGGGRFFGTGTFLGGPFLGGGGGGFGGGGFGGGGSAGGGGGAGR